MKVEMGAEVMSLLTNIIINIYSIAILGIIYFQSLKQEGKETLQYKLYLGMVQVTLLLVVLDIFGRFDGNPGTFYPIVNHLGNFLVFFINLVLPSLWFLYVHDQVFQKEEKTRRLMYFFVGLNVVNAALVIVSQFFGWFYYIDSNNIYHRGPLFFLSITIIICLIILASIISIVNLRKVERNRRFALVFFSIPPFVGVILQIMFYGISIMLIGAVISLLIVFLNIQNHSMYIDYLTKVNNRKKFDLYLKEKISTSTSDKTFSAIMIDLDNFKFINDTFGHDMGDKALKRFVKLLASCLKLNDFIARFGGDEFCVILDVSEISELESIVDRINKVIERYNKYNDQSYKLSLSMGYAVYDYDSHMEMEEFKKKIDLLMYENKQFRRQNMNEE